MIRRVKAVRAVLPILSGILIVLGEHLWRAEPARPFLSGLAAVLLIAAVGWSLAVAFGAERKGSLNRGSLIVLAAPTLLFALAAAIYFAGLLLPSDPGEGLDWPALFSWGWLLALLLGVVLFVFVEAAWLDQGEMPKPDPLRLRAAGKAGLSLGLLLLLVVTLNFVFNRLPWQWDLGYFRSAQPSDATSETIRNLDAPVSVTLFYPEDNPVRSLLRDYFIGLEGLSTHLEIGYYDADLHPAAAREHKARRNGLIVVSRDSVTRNISLGLTVEAARDKLAKFDSTFLSELAHVTREKRNAYFTVGHGERNEKGDSGRPVTSRIKGFEALLRAQNFTVKPLGLAEGLGQEVPTDADLVVVAGPRLPLRQSEEDALGRYLDQGGNLMAFLEPDSGKAAPGLPVAADAPPALSGLLAAYGVEYRPVVQANDRVFGRRTHTKADHALLATARYQNHPSVSSLRRNASQFPLLLLGSGAFRKGKAPEGLTVRVTIKGMPGTWGDENGNFEFDGPRERRREPILALAIERRKPRGKAAEDDAELPLPTPRILAFADADIASDLFIQNRANQMALLDGIAWLAGDVAPAAVPKEDEDLRIQHLKGDELLWFYLPVFAVPLMVLIAGFVIVRRAGGGLRRSSHV